MLSPPSAQEIRPAGSGRDSIRDEEEVGIIHGTLGTASLWGPEDSQYRRMRGEYTLREKKTLTVAFTR